MQKINPKDFDPLVLAESLEEELARESKLAEWFPTTVLTKVEYYIPGAVEIICPNKFIWQFDDFAPWYLRLRGFLEFWRDHIEGRISEVELWDGQSDEPIILKPESNFPSNGGPLLLN